MTERRLLLGNEAIARGLVENGCAIATSYPGTPASEILAAVAFFQKENKISMHTQWAVNEKIALEIAYAGCQTGLRTAVSHETGRLKRGLRSADECCLYGCQRRFYRDQCRRSRTHLFPDRAGQPIDGHDGQNSGAGSGYPAVRPKR